VTVPGKFSNRIAEGEARIKVASNPSQDRVNGPLSRPFGAAWGNMGLRMDKYTPDQMCQ
jgi:hypothetical protein